MIPIFMKVAVMMDAMDVPEQRKVHTYAVPRCGGLAMAFGAMIPVFFLYGLNELGFYIVIASAVILFFGVMDDFIGLDYRTKFAGQIIAALLVILCGGLSIKSLGMLLPLGITLPNFIAIPLTIFVIVGVTNAINLADGLDGLAGGISILSFCLIGYLAFKLNNYFITLLSFALMGAIFGFLRFNNYPAVLFMGDAGSQLLGFLAITLSLAVTQNHSPFNAMLPLMIVGVPVLDTIRVIGQRIIHGRPVFTPDKNHIHHKLMEFGFYQTEAVFLIYVLQSVMILSGFLFRFYSEWVLVILYVLFSGAILYTLVTAERTGWRLQREGLINLNAIKRRLRIIFRDAYTTIRVSFRMLQCGVPGIALISCLLLGEIPLYVSIVALLVYTLLIALLVLNHRWLEIFLRIILYLAVPMVLYYVAMERQESDISVLIKLYDACLLSLMIPAAVVMRFTRREEGFTITPAAFIILLIALAMAFIPGLSDSPENIRSVATRVIVLLFSFEVLIGELRGKLQGLGWAIVVALAILGVKGMG